MRISQDGLTVTLSMTKAEKDYENKLRLVSAVYLKSGNRPKASYSSIQDPDYEPTIIAVFKWEHSELEFAQEAVSFVKGCTDRAANGDIELKKGAVDSFAHIVGREWEDVEAKALSNITIR